jgi:hypothetical protein
VHESFYCQFMKQWLKWQHCIESESLNVKDGAALITSYFGLARKEQNCLEHQPIESNGNHGKIERRQQFLLHMRSPVRSHLNHRSHYCIADISMEWVLLVEMSISFRNIFKTRRTLFKNTCGGSLKKLQLQLDLDAYILKLNHIFLENACFVY